MSTTKFRILVLKGLVLILKRTMYGLNTQEGRTYIESMKYIEEVEKVIDDESKPKSKLM